MGCFGGCGGVYVSGVMWLRGGGMGLVDDGEGGGRRV